MKPLPLFALCLLMSLISSCVVTPPLGGAGFAPPPPPRVLMPVNLSVREQVFAPQIENVLRRAGYDPIYRGNADLLLEFTIDEGPVNVVTFIRLVDHGRILALGEGRASGPPLINRNRILEDSFYQALRMFESRVFRARPTYPTFR